MKKLGMIGGTGPESTVFYYRAIIRGVQEALGSRIVPRISIESMSVFDVLDFCSRGDYDGLAEYLGAAVQRLAESGAEFATFTGLTPHVVFDRVEAASPIPLISAIESTRDIALERGIARVALLGTEYTMTEDFFVGALRQAGMTVITPSSAEVMFIQEKIETELEHGIINAHTRDGLVDIIRRLRDREGAEQVVLGCTELPLLLTNTNCPIPCLDVVEIHTRVLIAAIVENALSC